MIPNPTVALVVVALGILAIYFELCRPGLVVPGVAGGVGVLVGLASIFRATEPIYWPAAAVILLPLLAITLLLARIAWRARAGKRFPAK